VLSELYIKNFAIIDELRVGFGSGLNVLTGETGAGKSIIVDSLGAALGQRVGSEVVRTGADQALAEAVFLLATEPSQEGGLALSTLEGLLGEHGLEMEEGLLILSREINRATGRTVARINSRPVPLSLLQQVGQLLVDIHGQSEHLSLLRVKEHVGYLDRYAVLMELRGQVGETVKELRGVRSEIEQMTRDERESAREMDLLRYQIEEIQAANLQEDEEERLQVERVRLRNSERLRETAHAAHELLAGGDEQPGAVDLLAQAERLYLELARLDPTQEEDRQSLEAARYAVEEIAGKARDYVEGVEDDPQQLNLLEERIELIRELKRKYGRTLGDVIKYCSDAESRLERLSNLAFYLGDLQQKEAALLERLGKLASELSASRRAASTRLAEEIQRELGALNMGGTRFQVSFSTTTDPKGVAYDSDGADGVEGGTRVAFDTTGVDRVEFLVAPNPGEEPKPLAKVASGGEMARLMLALKTILSKADAIPTLVFDEIDVGVGARSGTRVGEKLWMLTADHQVLCITHMPQIACMADRHLSVAKVVEGGRTRTAVRVLEGREMVEELATMLAGSAEFASAVASAEELLGRSLEYKGCSRQK
jgi:DNA repair protein RecN (Recombination protein N)